MFKNILNKFNLVKFLKYWFLLFIFIAIIGDLVIIINSHTVHGKKFTIVPTLLEGFVPILVFFYFSVFVIYFIRIKRGNLNFEYKAILSCFLSLTFISSLVSLALGILSDYGIILTSFSSEVGLGIYFWLLPLTIGGTWAFIRKYIASRESILDMDTLI